VVAKIELTGQQFGRLTVLHSAGSCNGRAYWFCQCSCGAQKAVSSSSLRRGSTRSCGCLVVDTSRTKAINNQIGGYKGWAKYKTVDDYLQNTARTGRCMDWQGAVYRNGYAKFPKNSRIPTEVGHRAVFFLVHGYLPPVVRHSCDNRRCINPEHLLPGTVQDNTDDKVARGRDTHLRKLTPDQVRAIRTESSTGRSANSLAKEYGVSKQTVLAIIHQRIWRHI